jgi:hypothetical protein
VLGVFSKRHVPKYIPNLRSSKRFHNGQKTYLVAALANLQQQVLWHLNIEFRDNLNPYELRKLSAEDAVASN